MAFQTDAGKGQTIGERIRYWGTNKPDLPAFIFWGPKERQYLSRGEILDLSSRFASRLIKHGVQPGDVVCISLPNSPERVVADFGIHLAGGVSMNGQILRADGEDLLDSLRLSKCKLVIANPDEAAGAWSIFSQHVKIENRENNFASLVHKDMPTLQGVLFCRPSKSTNPFIASVRHEERYIGPSTNQSDIAYIFCTSGSSGYTKLVPYSHEKIVTVADKLRNVTGVTEMDKFCSCAPLGWIGGFPGHYFACGSSRVLFDDFKDDFPPAEKLPRLWEMLQRENVKVCSLSPAILMALYDQRSLWEGSGYKIPMTLVGGQPLKKDNLELVIGTFTKSILCLYASSEAGAIACMRLDSNNMNIFKDNMVGSIINGLEVKIVDRNMEPVRPCCRGEILIRGDTVTNGYLESSSKFLDDGWFLTDDVGYLTDAGYLVVEGRSSDAIMHGTYILYPAWLEDKLRTCPGVKQVVIVPVPDRVLHHEICACVIPIEPLQKDKIIAFCKRELILKVPEQLNVTPKYVIFVDTFPKNKNGKLNRKELSQIAAGKLNLL